MHAIRGIHIDDASWIFEACQDEQIQFWTTIPKPYLREHAQSFVRGEIPEYKIWVIEEAGAERVKRANPVGVISIHGVDEAGVAEIGYWIAPWGRGKGATKAAIDLVASYAASDPNIKHLQACISDLNVVSQKVAIAAGFEKRESACRTCPAGSSETSATNYRRSI